MYSYSLRIVARCVSAARYKEGMLKARVEDRETINLIEGAAAGMVATVDAHGHEAVQEWEVSRRSRARSCAGVGGESTLTGTRLCRSGR